MDWTATFEPQWVVSLVPASSSTFYETALDLVDAGLVARDPIGLIAASRSVADVPVPWLPYLAEERSVDEFSSAWPELRQRAVTAASFGVHQVKGTRPALDRAFSPQGYFISVIEWFETLPERRPYTFRLFLTIDQDREWVFADRASVIRTANKAKNAHTKLDAIEFARDVGPAAIYVGGVLYRERELIIDQVPVITEFTIDAMVFIGAAQIRNRELTIGPRP